MKAKIIEVHLPEYHIKTKPDYVKLGKKVDEVIEENFSDGKYIIRALGSDDHPDLSINKLVDIILETGTDRYDPSRKDVCYDEFCCYDYDIQAGTITIKNRKLIIPKDYKYLTEFGDIVWHFYEHTLLDRGYAVRIDLLLIYDPKQVTKSRKFHLKAEGLRRGLNNYLYKFKYPKNKKEALLGIIKILR